MSQLSSVDTSQTAAASDPNPSLLDRLSILSVPGMGCTTINRLVSSLGSPALVLSARKEQLLQIEGVGPKLASMLTDSVRMESARQRAMAEVRQAAGNNCRILCPEDDLYPRQLKTITDPPVALYCQGNVEYLAKPAVAIVGSRAATSYGKKVSFKLAKELARQGICVVSGMAMGIDGEAHAGALAEGGITIGVLGCGIDVVYPHQHANLFREVSARGLLLSEYPLGTPPDGFRFPERNRIISGISLGTLVVEASLKSGSLITATLALDQGREVFAVPGRIDSPRSQGTHRLLQQGAKLVNSVDDILQELDLAGMLEHNGAEDDAEVCRIKLAEEEKHLISCLDVYPVTIDELVRESGYDTAAVFKILLQLELKGIVRQLPGQQYELLHHCDVQV